MSDLYQRGSTEMPARGDDPRRVRPKRFVADAKRLEALRLFEAGCGYRQTAKRLGLSVNTVRDWRRLYAAGQFRERIGRRQFVYTEKARREAISMRENGATWREVQEATGAKPSSVRNWMRALKESVKEPEQS